jgi:Arc/MetJ-type ribon-helix-helix transcriptional regulator
MNDSKKITVNLPSDQVEFLQDLAKEGNISFTDALRRAINSERFFVDQEKTGKKVLVEDNGKVREVIRR